MLPQDGARALVSQLAAIAPPLFVMGGFAEDALLYHRVVGPHADLDVLVLRPQLSRCLQQLRARGLGAPEDRAQQAPGYPLVLRAALGYPQIEVWVSTPEAEAGFSLDVAGRPDASRLRIFLPEDTFDYPATTLGGVAIQTVSPLALYQLRAISAMTRSVGEKQVRDLAMQERLRQVFLATCDEAKLTPRFAGM
jgi:hypothetical protein